MADTMNEVVYNIVRNHITEHRGVTNFTTQVELVETVVRECLSVVDRFKFKMSAGADNVTVAIKEHFGVE